MSKRTVFIETSVVSYLATNLSRNLVVVGHQRIASDWWNDIKPNLDYYISDLVEIEEVKDLIADIDRGSATCK